LVKQLKATRLRLISARSNARFVARHPDEPMPPLDLMVDAHAHASYQRYWDRGTETARFLFDIFTKHLEPNGAKPVRVLEWGCGSGRLLRHLRGLYGPGAVSLHGSDYNRSSVQWCREAYPDIGFSTNDLAPPLQVGDSSVDVAYAVSVLTHLPDDLCRAWIAELTPRSPPGG
jgi:SAM-dependent methyltransferase